MPYKAKKPCARTGCRHLTNEWYCEEHAKAEAKRYDQFERDPASKKRYGKSWAKIRARSYRRTLSASCAIRTAGLRQRRWFTTRSS